MDSTLPDSDWIAEPTVELFHDERGRVESAFVQVRRAPYARAVQPNPDYAVFLYVASDDLPIGVRMLEPVSGEFRTEILFQLVRDGSGAAREAKQVRHSFRPLPQVDKTAHRLEEANLALEAART